MQRHKPGHTAWAWCTSQCRKTLRTHAGLRWRRAFSGSGLQSPKIPWSQSSALGTCFQTRVAELFCLEHTVEGSQSRRSHETSSPVPEHSTGAGAEILGENHLPAPGPPPTPSERALPRPFSSVPFGSFLWPRATSSSSRPLLRSFFQNVSPAQCLAPLQPEVTFRSSICLCASGRGGTPLPQEGRCSPLTLYLDTLECRPLSHPVQSPHPRWEAEPWSHSPGTLCKHPPPGLATLLFPFFTLLSPGRRSVFSRMKKNILSLCFWETFLPGSPYLFLFTSFHYSVRYPLRIQTFEKFKKAGKC